MLSPCALLSAGANLLALPGGHARLQAWRLGKDLH